MTENLPKLIAELGLDKYADALLRMSKPTIELVPSESDIHLGCSKFGGSPDVPPNFEWPRHELGDYRFIGQINLAEIPKADIRNSVCIAFTRANSS